MTTFFKVKEKIQISAQNFEVVTVMLYIPI